MTRAVPPAAGSGDTEGVPLCPDPELARLLRQAVFDHAVADRRRVHPPYLHVGLPGRPHPVFPVRPDEPTDHALRVDVVAALLKRAGEGALVWLVRSGELTLQDVDAAWLAAARAAYAEAGSELVFVVVNRHAWWDPRSDARRTWRRLRER